MVLEDGVVTVFPPMGLDKHAVDLLEVHDASLVADRFDERTQAQVAGAAQESLAGTNDERQGFLGEGVVAQAGTVELFEDEVLGGFRPQAGQDRRVSDAGTDLLVDGQRQGLEEWRLADEHQVMGAGEVLAKQAQLAQAV